MFLQHKAPLLRLRKRDEFFLAQQQRFDANSIEAFKVACRVPGGKRLFREMIREKPMHQGGMVKKGGSCFGYDVPLEKSPAHRESPLTEQGAGLATLIQDRWNIGHRQPEQPEHDDDNGGVEEQLQG